MKVNIIKKGIIHQGLVGMIMARIRFEIYRISPLATIISIFGSIFAYAFVIGGVISAIQVGNWKTGTIQFVAGFGIGLVSSCLAEYIADRKRYNTIVSGKKVKYIVNRLCNNKIKRSKIIIALIIFIILMGSFIEYSESKTYYIEIPVSKFNPLSEDEGIYVKMIADRVVTIAEKEPMSYCFAENNGEFIGVIMISADDSLLNDIDEYGYLHKPLILKGKSMKMDKDFIWFIVTADEFFFINSFEDFYENLGYSMMDIM